MGIRLTAFVLRADIEAFHSKRPFKYSLCHARCTKLFISGGVCTSYRENRRGSARNCASFALGWRDKTNPTGQPDSPGLVLFGDVRNVRSVMSTWAKSCTRESGRIWERFLQLRLPRRFVSESLYSFLQNPWRERRTSSRPRKILPGTPPNARRRHFRYINIT